MKTIEDIKKMETAMQEAFNKLGEKEKNHLAGCLRIMEQQEDNWLELLIVFATAQRVEGELRNG